MRGKELDAFKITFDDGITPAHAGKSYPLRPVRWLRRDHPRACGEKKPFEVDGYKIMGSPPRMRGKD